MRTRLCTKNAAHTCQSDLSGAPGGSAFFVVRECFLAPSTLSCRCRVCGLSWFADQLSESLCESVDRVKLKFKRSKVQINRLKYKL